MAIAAIAFGIIAMMLTNGFIEWLYWATRELVAVTQFGHMQVVKPGYHREGTADPLAYLLPASKAELSLIKRQPEVRSISPRIYFNGLISHGEATLSFMAMGVDPAHDPSLRHLIILAGRLIKPNDQGSILIGSGLASNLGVHMGDQVVLLSNTPNGGVNAVEARVEGLVSTSMKAYDDTLVWVPIELARRLLHVDGAHMWVVTLHLTEQTKTVYERLKSITELGALEIVPWYQEADIYHKTIRLLGRQIIVVKIIIAIIILLGITNTLSMNVMERTVEIGTAMALGARRRRIMSQFMLEGTLLGIAGGVLGIAFGYALAQLISYVGIPMPPSPGMSRGFTAAIIVTPSAMLEGLLLAVVTTWLASLYPAWRAAQLVIVEALRRGR